MTRTLLALLATVALVLGLSYRLMSRAITDARAEGAAQVVDAGTPVDAGYTAPDPVVNPAGSLSELRKFWQYGGWQGLVLAFLMISKFVVVRLEPKDEDGDGKPDPHGWQGMTWAIAAAAMAVLGPLVAIAAGVAGAGFNSVVIGIVTAVPLLISNLNPKRGAVAGAGTA